MVSINPNRIKRLQLTNHEQQIVLQNSHFIDKSIYERILNSPTGAFHLLDYEVNNFRLSLSHQLDLTTNEEVKEVLSKIFNKLSANPIISKLSDELVKHNFESIEEVEQAIGTVYNKHNSTPDPGMGGLSPNQIGRLLHSNWDDSNCPIKFNKNLTIDDLKQSPFFHNARLLLNTLIQMEKENTATAKGNLTRNVVKAVFDRIIISESDRKFILKYKKIINELDVRPLHYIRVVCESTGIIELQKKKFIVKKKYIELLDDKNAGKLFYLLFFCYFRKFNIGYVDRSPDFDCIQDTIPYSFYRLSKLEKKDIKVNKLKKQLFLPAVIDDLNDGHIYSSDTIDEITWLVESRIIEPLELFGIVECSYKEKVKNYLVIDKVKKTELFDKFMKFEV